MCAGNVYRDGVQHLTSSVAIGSGGWKLLWTRRMTSEFPIACPAPKGCNDDRVSLTLSTVTASTCLHKMRGSTSEVLVEHVLHLEVQLLTQCTQ